MMAIEISIRVLLLVIFIIVWTLIWKGLALWKAGRNSQLAWFIVLLLVDTLGILEILYIFVFQKERNKKLRKRK